MQECLTIRRIAKMKIALARSPIVIPSYGLIPKGRWGTTAGNNLVRMKNSSSQPSMSLKVNLIVRFLILFVPCFGFKTTIFENIYKQTNDYNLKTQKTKRSLTWHQVWFREPMVGVYIHPGKAAQKNKRDQKISKVSFVANFFTYNRF